MMEAVQHWRLVGERADMQFRQAAAFAEGFETQASRLVIRDCAEFCA
jgi:hypothetical protein